MTRRAALLILAIVLSPMIQAAPVQDLSGKWDGSFIISVNGETQDDVAFMALTQKGATVTGTVGPTLDRQWPIQNGKIDGAKVTFDAQSDDALIKFSLTLTDGRLKGDAKAEMGGQVMTAKVDVGRSK